MNNKPRSFRLTPEAAAELESLARFYSLSENRVINILLTWQDPRSVMEDKHSAIEILEAYHVDKVLSRIQRNTDKLVERNNKLYPEQSH